MFHCYWNTDGHFSETESDFRSDPFSLVEDEFDTNLIEPAVSYTEGEE